MKNPNLIAPTPTLATMAMASDFLYEQDQTTASLRYRQAHFFVYPAARGGGSVFWIGSSSFSRISKGTPLFTRRMSRTRSSTIYHTSRTNNRSGSRTRSTNTRQTSFYQTRSWTRARGNLKCTGSRSRSRSG